jgi:hypothetical protein
MPCDGNGCRVPLRRFAVGTHGVAALFSGIDSMVPWQPERDIRASSGALQKTPAD